MNLLFYLGAFGNVKYCWLKSNKSKKVAIKAMKKKDIIQSKHVDHIENVEINHWRCLNDCMWSENSAVKVVSYRMLHRLKEEGWPQDLLDMIYLTDEELEWAKEGIVEVNPNAIVHKDSNGVTLQHGDSVVVIKDLNVKGSSLVAKRGTAVRNITLVSDNAEHIEGRVEGQHIVILTQYVKKS